MDKKLKIFLGLVVMALCFAAGSLFGPGQAQSYSTCRAGKIYLSAAGLFGVFVDEKVFKISKVERDSDKTVYITVAKR